jgi:hypothetical protein
MFPTPENGNVTLLHFTKANPPNPTQPIQVAFTVVDNHGREMIVTGGCLPSELYSLYRENGWLDKTSQIKAVEKTKPISQPVANISRGRGRTAAQQTA